MRLRIVLCFCNAAWTSNRLYSPPELKSDRISAHCCCTHVFIGHDVCVCVLSRGCEGRVTVCQTERTYGLSSITSGTAQHILIRSATRQITNSKLNYNLMYALYIIVSPLTSSFQAHWNSGVESSPNKNEYHGSFLGVKAAGLYGWQPCHIHVPSV
jgi:hypothetical protein